MNCCLSLHVSPVIDWRPVDDVPCLSPDDTRDQLQPPKPSTVFLYSKMEHIFIGVFKEITDKSLTTYFRAEDLLHYPTSGEKNPSFALTYQCRKQSCFLYLSTPHLNLPKYWSSADRKTALLISLSIHVFLPLICSGKIHPFCCDDSMLSKVASMSFSLGISSRSS